MAKESPKPKTEKPQAGLENTLPQDVWGKFDALMDKALEGIKDKPEKGKA